MSQRPSFDHLPLFAGERELSVALLGAERACEWKDLAPLLERRGLPKIDALLGGRYSPAVKAFFDHEYNLTPAAPAAPPGRENITSWNTRERKRSA